MTEDQETLICVGGPFDGKEATTDKWCLTLVKDSLPDDFPEHFLTRSFYTREPPGGYPAIWRFVGELDPDRSFLDLMFYGRSTTRIPG